MNEDARHRLVQQLMDARRDVGSAKRAGNIAGEQEARVRVDAAKRELGERGAVWWEDGARDFNRHLARNTPYAEWFAAVDIKDS
ncbi:hypothetical protein [Sphingobium sp. B2]|uniref:hypothetical protein n=1 Tax=Sphingobium sp. B2 TaxID=2583228 RepID=UPI0028F43021|nr:hypothetical protein [Sphingobium sp. B2]